MVNVISHGEWNKLGQPAGEYWGGGDEKPSTQVGACRGGGCGRGRLGRGHRRAHGRIGDETVTFGLTNLVNPAWVTASIGNKTLPRHLYALSSHLTVAAVPLPGALILYGSGLACMAVLRRRNRSVRPA